ncbi:hypothetical protein [Paenibacillus sp. EPM92]|uniref:hypothetical protein n=1 Tax=Paenibacillus sp. EPM92 TaxID=1561195 RepID=UPI001915D4EC|nr:hypothetical protein [Paenibacillus sp. EPM92]
MRWRSGYCPHEIHPGFVGARRRGDSPLIRQLRYRLDEAGVVLLFAWAGVMFLGVFAVFPKEKGCIDFAMFSCCQFAAASAPCLEQFPGRKRCCSGRTAANRRQGLA